MLLGALEVGVAAGATAAADAAGPLPLAIEVASVPIGDARLSIRVQPAPPAGDASDAHAGAVAGLPEIRREDRRLLLRSGAGEAELHPDPADADGGAPARYRLDPPLAGEVTRTGPDDAAEWTVRTADGLERVLRASPPGASRWRVMALRHPGSGGAATVEHDGVGRLARIATADGVEWRFEYQRPSPEAAAVLGQVTARLSANVGGEMLYRARLDHRRDASGRMRLERVRAASRAPAGVTELVLVWTPASPAGGSGAPGERLERITAPHGDVAPRFEYADGAAIAVFSAVPSEDAYDTRYPVTVQLAAEYVGEDLLEDALGRRTIAFDETARERYRLQVRGGRVLTADGSPLDTGGAAFLIVLAPDGELYASRGDYVADTKVHHSSFLAGAPVAAAGEIVAREGRVVRITSRSGHYRPPMCLLDQLRAELERRGVDLTGVPFEKGF